jgi:hypothetical protein
MSAPKIEIRPGEVFVNGKLFARWAVEEAEPARDYGCSHVLRTWPLIGRQGEPGWYEVYKRVKELLLQRAHEQIDSSQLSAPRG